MKLNKPNNPNYCATIVEIKKIVELDNCDNLQGAIIMGNQVIVDKSTKVGDVGIFFPLETQLSHTYLHYNNLYRHEEKNINIENKGYFEDNGRVRCVKLRGNKSEGIFMPLKSLEFVLGEDINKLKINDEFDELNSIEICRKYIVQTKISNSNNPKTKKQSKLKELLIDNQFRFHDDTLMLYKNIHKIKPEDLISITYKEHGSSGIVSNTLIKRQLNIFEKILSFFGVNIHKEEYGYVYSSGKPKSKLPKGVVGRYQNPNKDFYKSNIWQDSFEYLKDYLSNGLTLYYEIVGYTRTGSMIQGDFDYGCEPPTNNEYIEGVNYKIKIYRITFTNNQGKVFEFSAKQVQDWCTKLGLNAVEEIYYGYAKDLFKFDKRINIITWQEKFLEFIKNNYNEKDCYICNNKVPEEGVVIRIENNEFEAYKQKSNRFYALETKMLDKGVVDIENEI